MARGTIQNREAFLDHIAKRMGRERRAGQVQRPDWKYQPQKQVYEDLSQDELIGVLKDICGAIHADVKETQEADLPKVLEEAVRAYGGGPIVTSDDLRFLGLGLGSFLGREDVHVWDPSRGKENIDIAEKANIGITFSDITLAESGTVVLFSAKEKGRSISLLPTNYIALIPKSTVVPRMTQAAQRIHEQTEAGEGVASCVSLVTGPSNSADIEMRSVRGVHGPVEATYIIITDK